MAQENAAAELAFGKEVLEVGAGACRDVLSEKLPAFVTVFERLA